MNLDILRRKRIQRLRIKAPAHSGQRRIYFILERATRKFPGDIGLWMQYIEYARKQKAYKKLSQIFTAVVRLHPAKPQLWIYAAQFFMDEHADMTEARSYMQRGLRFCKSSKDLWIEYAKLELIYMAKIAARKKILGLGANESEGGVVDEESDDDMMVLPKLTAEDINPSLPAGDEVDEIALQNLESTPALSGAIPIAIFDAAMKQFEFDSALAQDFFDLAAKFDTIPQRKHILQHIVSALRTSKPASAAALLCEVKLTLVGTEASSLEFPRAFGLALRSIRSILQDSNSISSRVELATDATSWLLSFLSEESLDPALRTLASATIKQLLRIDVDGTSLGFSLQQNKPSMVTRLRDVGIELN